jgi:hypothetical protein
MPDPIALKVIEEPEPGSRPVLVQRHKGVPFFRGEERAPSLSCGTCGEVLATGMSLKHFTTFEGASALGVTGIPFKDGPQPVTVTYNIQADWYFAGNTHLVLRCPTCAAYNDTVASITA